MLRNPLSSALSQVCRDKPSGTRKAGPPVKDDTVAIEGEQGHGHELRIAPGARPRDLLTAIGARGALAAASRPAPLAPDDDLYEVVATRAHLVLEPTGRTKALARQAGGRRHARHQQGARHGQ